MCSSDLTPNPSLAEKDSIGILKLMSTETVLKQLIRKDYLPWFMDWIDTATGSEKTGLEIVKFILDTRGLVKADQTVQKMEPSVKELYQSEFEYACLTQLQQVVCLLH